jgi:hypothetical protein
MATADNISELRIRTPPPDAEERPKKSLRVSTARLLGLFAAFYIIGVLLVELHHSTTPHLILSAIIAVVALLPICLAGERESVLPK